ncbi:MFS transporter [Ereboglobus luteus]|uniref:MFS transporter n=1 Tax=Ereboglobus luteus TaxID=1796921 RepID=A0A2U8E4K9_9BACT|nr:MFS transporter [Ereboglobus luteus]
MDAENPAREHRLNVSRQLPKGFRTRRGVNWGIIGLLYTSFYMCRYNFSIANKSIATEFGFSNEQIGWIISVNMFAYACGQIVNGLLADKLGGKRAMLIGVAGTIIMNILFGVASFAGLLWLFVMLRGIDGYLQAFGAPGFIKINVTWFNKRERGKFSGIFGFMINLGRLGIFWLGPSLLAGFTLFGMFHVDPLHWRWLFWVPSGIAMTVAIVFAFVVKNTPEEAGYHVDELKDQDTAANGGASGEKEPTVKDVFLRIVSNPVIWMVAFAYACTGTVRQSVDQWFPRYVQEVFSTDLKGPHFFWLGTLIPIVASAGSLVSGYVSDTFANGRRAPVAAVIYFIETIIIILAAQASTLNGVIVFFILIAFTANSTHSLLGTAAAMDIGGKKMAGFASGVIDSFQYFGGFLAGFLLGRLLDGKGWVFDVFSYLHNLILGTPPEGHMGWGLYFYFMAPFGMTGCILILIGARMSKKRGMTL